jgi:DNA modification methylase
MNQLFKTISFPKEKSGTNKTELIRLAFSKNTDLSLYENLKILSSADIRVLLHDISYKKLVEMAAAERRSLNQICLFLLTKKIDEIRKNYGSNVSIANILSKNLVYTSINKKSATFHDNKMNKIHRWYPYIEGYSCTFVEQIIDNLTYNPTLIYDPLSGAGTTQIVASHKNIPSAYSEINPYMNFIIDCKVNKVIQYIRDFEKNNDKINEFMTTLSKNLKSVHLNEDQYNKCIWRLGSTDYFDREILENLLRIKFAIKEFFRNSPLPEAFCLFALSTIIVTVSNMIKRADLRYKRTHEKKFKASDVVPLFTRKINEILSDISEIKDLPLCASEFVSFDAKQIPESYKRNFDLVITSPPYVNGTNYYRNTKLELVLLDFIHRMNDINMLKKEAITSGISNVTLRNIQNIKIPILQPIIDSLKKCAYDKRIPILVGNYFYDINKVFSSVSLHLTPESHLYIDIGDSQFAGVHVPTDEILIKIAERNNLELMESKFIRERYSKNGMPLKQVLLLFRKNRKTKNFYLPIKQSASTANKMLATNYQTFKETLPYRETPYSSRSWGHGLHNLCSYQGKLKPAIAHFLVKLFSTEGMRILDPLCGVGTVPLEACLQGRIGIGNDLSLLAYVNTFAKVCRPDHKIIHEELHKLNQYIKNHLVSRNEVLDLQFGYNQNITEYYHEDTLREIITARNYFKNNAVHDCEKALLISALMHVLHGNRPYALSRRSHNVTPLAPTGPFEYKALIEKTANKIKKVLGLIYPVNYVSGRAINDDYRNLFRHIEEKSIDLIITSPPFFDSTRFYMSNWIRMWFCGWDKDDFNRRKEDFLETQQVKSMDVYKQFFQICKVLLKDTGVIILHLGLSKKHDMGRTLSEIANKEFIVWGLFDENVSHCEKYGIKDQGATRAHQFLFLTK